MEFVYSNLVSIVFKVKMKIGVNILLVGLIGCLGNLSVGVNGMLNWFYIIRSKGSL